MSEKVHVPNWADEICDLIHEQDPMHDMSAYDWNDKDKVLEIWDHSARIYKDEETGRKEDPAHLCFNLENFWPGGNTKIEVINGTLNDVKLAIKAGYMINNADE